MEIEERNKEQEITMNEFIQKVVYATNEIKKINETKKPDKTKIVHISEISGVMYYNVKDFIKSSRILGREIEIVGMPGDPNFANMAEFKHQDIIHYIFLNSTEEENLGKTLNIDNLGGANE